MTYSVNWSYWEKIQLHQVVEDLICEVDLCSGFISRLLCCVSVAKEISSYDAMECLEEKK